MSQFNYELIALTSRIAYLNEERFAYVAIEIYVHEDEADEDNEVNQLKVENSIFVFKYHLVSSYYFSHVTTVEA